MRVKATVQYLGSRFAGWQLQPNAPTVQGSIEDALATVFGRSVRIHGAGRTDAGVHALGQVAAFDVDEGTDVFRLKGSLNALCGDDITIASLEEVPEEFDPRRDAVRRGYRYTVANSRTLSPFLRGRAWHVTASLDDELLDRLAVAVMGKHDFSAFRAADCPAKRTRRTITTSQWSRTGTELEYRIESIAFLKQQVRVLVGSMIDVALGRLTEETFLRLLEGGDRTEAGRTAPADGLVLTEVVYAAAERA